MGGREEVEKRETLMRRKRKGTVQVSEVLKTKQNNNKKIQHRDVKF